VEPGGLARSTRFDDVYQPDIDGGQARAVFVAGSGLPARFGDGRRSFTVLELGFGTGTNFLETWRAWSAAAAPCRLEYVGIDGFLLSPEEARRVAMARSGALAGALAAAHAKAHAEVLAAGTSSAAEEAAAPVSSTAPAADQAGPAPAGPALTADVARLVAAWPAGPGLAGPRDAVCAVDLGTNDLVLTLHNAPFEEAVVALAEARPRSVDAVYLDGFAPSRNPSAWTDAIFRSLGELVVPGGTAVTWSVASAVRRGMGAAGFDVQRAPGHGRKRERLVAVREG
jgi:tRNA 5-methylaminomethyl-2-thiouridine biosynthesis bifunctional protein